MQKTLSLFLHFYAKSSRKSDMNRWRKLFGTEKRMWIGGHRGWGKKKIPAENTKPAFDMALNSGLDWIETDILMSRDGTLFIAHGPDGSLAGRPDLDLESLDFEELKKLDFSWYIRQGSPQGLKPESVSESGLVNKSAVEEGTRPDDGAILTLESFLELYAGKISINLELKRRESLAPLFSGKFERETARLVRPYLKKGASIFCSSFNALSLIRLRKYLPEGGLGILWESATRFWVETRLLFFLVRPDFLHPPADRVDKKLMDYAQKKGYRVHAWVVNDKNTAERFRNLGVDAILTDECEEALQWFKEKN